jgi:hypothetical protein
MSNQADWFNQQIGMQNQLAMNGRGQSYPESASEILSVALSRAKQRRDFLQTQIDSLPKLQDEKLNLEALIARLEGKEDE